MNLGEFLNSNATQLGISPEDAFLKSITGNANVTAINVPDELVTSFSDAQKGLMTEEAAKQNPNLKKHFSALALNIVDTELENTAEKMGVEKEKIKEIYAREKYTNKRVEAIAKELETAIKAKNALAPTDDKKHEKLNEQIEGLNKDILRINAERETERSETKLATSNKLREYKYNEIFNRFDYTGEIPKDVQAITARNVFSRALKANNLKVEFEEETGNLSLFTNENTDHFKDNKKVSFDDFLNSTLAENGLLKVTKTVAAPVKVTPTPVQIAAGTPNTSRMSEALNESAKAFATVGQ